MMGGVELRYPPADVDAEPSWWLPLERAAERAARQGLRRRLDRAEFEARGCVERPGRPAVWVYRHHRTGRELYLDSGGRAQRFTRVRGRQVGRFTEIDLRRAVLAARVWTDQPVVQPVPPPDLPVVRRRGPLALLAGGCAPRSEVTR
jgi:hypothetical protein